MKKIKFNLEIINALVWAAVIILCNIFIDDNGNIFNFFLAGATISFLWVDKLVHNRKRCSNTNQTTKEIAKSHHKSQ